MGVTAGGFTASYILLNGSSTCGGHYGTTSGIIKLSSKVIVFENYFMAVFSQLVS
jgi:hypothetical protein